MLARLPSTCSSSSSDRKQQQQQHSRIGLGASCFPLQRTVTRSAEEERERKRKAKKTFFSVDETRHDREPMGEPPSALRKPNGMRPRPRQGGGSPRAASERTENQDGRTGQELAASGGRRRDGPPEANARAGGKPQRRDAARKANGGTGARQWP